AFIGVHTEGPTVAAFLAVIGPLSHCRARSGDPAYASDLGISVLPRGMPSWGRPRRASRWGGSQTLASMMLPRAGRRAWTSPSSTAWWSGTVGNCWRGDAPRFSGRLNRDESNGGPDERWLLDAAHARCHFQPTACNKTGFLPTG